MLKTNSNSIKAVLLVEDETTIATLYKIKLELQGFSVITAHNGVDALEKLRDFTPDLILLDLMMPVISGDKFLEKLRTKTPHKDTPVIILTNLSKQEAPKTIWHYGVSAYFVKAHHTPSELVKLIEGTFTDLSE